MLQGIPGAQEVKVEQTTGLPMLTVKIDREKAAREASGTPRFAARRRETVNELEL